MESKTAASPGKILRGRSRPRNCLHSREGWNSFGEQDLFEWQSCRLGHREGERSRAGNGMHRGWGWGLHRTLGLPVAYLCCPKPNQCTCHQGQSAMRQGRDAAGQPRLGGGTTLRQSEACNRWRGGELRMPPGPPTRYATATARARSSLGLAEEWGRSPVGRGGGSFVKGCC